MAGLDGADSRQVEQIAYDPHSTISGTFAELGLLGLAALSLAAVGLWRLGRSTVRDERLGTWNDRAALVVAVGALGLEAISTDVMHLRPAWVVLGLLAALEPHRQPAVERGTTRWTKDPAASPS
jgi:hypothetical protein